MIINRTRISSGSNPKYLINHLFHGAENEHIVSLIGNEADIHDAFAHSRDWGRKYAVRHFTINPDQPMTRSQAKAVADRIADEFKFPKDEYLLIEHKKGRQDGKGYNRHWHLCVREVNPATGRVLDDKNCYARLEKISRLTEVELDHQITIGRHMGSIIKHLRKDGHEAAADKLQAAWKQSDPAEPPRASYSRVQHQMLKRKGINLAEMKSLVQSCWERTSTADELTNALDKIGCDITREGKNWVLQVDGNTVGPLYRFIKGRKRDVEQRFNQEKHHEAIPAQSPPDQPESPARPVNSDLPRGPRSTSGSDGHPGAHRETGRVRQSGPRPPAGREHRKDRSSFGADRTAAHQDREEAALAFTTIQLARFRSRLRAAQELVQQRRAQQRQEAPKRFQLPPDAFIAYDPTKRTDTSRPGFLDDMTSLWKDDLLNEDLEVIQKQKCVEIRGHDWVVRDLGNIVYCQGSRSDAIEILCNKAIRDWGSRMEIHGDEDFLNRTWLRCQELGIDVSVRGQPDWQPLPEVAALAYNSMQTDEEVDEVITFQTHTEESYAPPGMSF